ncbi:PEP-CTERM sorting domain-containing protein [Tundrisphaera lichenicola]|uniref:PEP-CTERM sorting domain-containing protein n=1 Tax=Tundrisphaera lichenicola TaxID=2029860 RepID=UPI003EB6C4F9
MHKALGLGLAACVLAASSSQSAFLTGDASNSTSNLGNYTGSLNVTDQMATTATLTITLKNTSTNAGGYLTAFVLNNPGDSITGVSLSLHPANFGLLGLDNNNVGGSPFGQFDFGASTSGSFEGGGPPSKGIAIGSSGTFVFHLTGTNLTSLTDASFLNTLSTGNGAGQGYQPFVVRFRGFTGGGSDKVPVLIPNAAVPEPSSLALIGIAGTVGLMVRRVRNRLGS